MNVYPFYFFFKRLKKYSKNHIFKAGMLLVIVIIYSVFSEYYLENNIASSGIHNLFTSLWWTMQTITTVGYGDTPVYGEYGRINGMAIMLIGIGSLGYFTAAVTTILIDSRLAARLGDKMAVEKKHIIICNYNDTAKKVLDEISAAGYDIVILNQDDIPQKNDYTFIKGNFLNENDLIKAGIKKASIILIFSKNEDRDSMAIDAETILSAMIARKLNNALRIIGEILNPSSRMHAEPYIDDIIIKGDVSSMLIYSSINIPGMPELFNEMLKSGRMGEDDINDVQRNMTFKEFLEIMQKNGKTVIGFRKNDVIMLANASDNKVDMDSYIYINN